MKKSLVFLVFFLASCASVANYPISLSYAPPKQVAKGDGRTIAVATLYDMRSMPDKKVIGSKDGEEKFVALIDEPADMLSKAFETHLKKKGYGVIRLNELWDGTAETIKPAWGDVVIGGFLEDFTLSVKTSSLVKTEYVCSVKLYILIADINSRKMLHRERFEVSSSYVTVGFSRDKAEELINNALAEAVGRSLANVNDYLPGRQT